MEERYKRLKAKYLESMERSEQNLSQETLRKESKPFSSFKKTQNFLPENEPEKITQVCHLCISCMKDKTLKKKKKVKEVFLKEQNVIDLNQIGEKDTKGILQYHQKRQRDLQGILRYSQFLQEAQQGFGEKEKTKPEIFLQKEEPKIPISFPTQNTQDFAITEKPSQVQEKKISFNFNQENPQKIVTEIFPSKTGLEHKEKDEKSSNFSFDNSKSIFNNTDQGVKAQEQNTGLFLNKEQSKSVENKDENKTTKEIEIPQEKSLFGNMNKSFAQPQGIFQIDNKKTDSINVFGNPEKPQEKELKIDTKQETQKSSIGLFNNQENKGESIFSLNDKGVSLFNNTEQKTQGVTQTVPNFQNFIGSGNSFGEKKVTGVFDNKDQTQGIVFGNNTGENKGIGLGENNGLFSTGNPTEKMLFNHSEPQQNTNIPHNPFISKIGSNSGKSNSLTEMANSSTFNIFNQNKQFQNLQFLCNLNQANYYIMYQQLYAL